MKTPKHLKFLAIGTGIAGAAFRVALYITGLDGKGLPIRGHWAGTALLLLTLAVFAWFSLRSRSLPDSGEYRDAYPASVAGGIGCLAAAMAFLLAGLPESMVGSLKIPELILRYGSVFSLSFLAMCRFTGRKPLFLFHGIVCLYLMLRLICLYRFWSPDPQLIDYGYYLGSYIAMILACYQLAAFDAGLGSHRKLWFWGLVSVYLCAVSLSGNQEPLFLLLCIIWIFTGLSRINPANE